MKKLILLGIGMCLISCDGIDSKDSIISQVLKIETVHLKRYNTLQKLSKDTATVNYISKVKDSLKLDAFEAKGVLNSRSGIMHGSLSESKVMLDEYIELCKNK